MKSKHPDKLRPKIISVIYVCLALPELIDEAKRKGVWILKATKDHHKPDLKQQP